MPHKFNTKGNQQRAVPKPDTISPHPHVDAPNTNDPTSLSHSSAPPKVNDVINILVGE